MVSWYSSPALCFINVESYATLEIVLIFLTYNHIWDVHNHEIKILKSNEAVTQKQCISEKFPNIDLHFSELERIELYKLNSRRELRKQYEISDTI